MAESRSSDGRRAGGGLKIAPRFAIATSLAVAVILVVFAFVLLNATNRIVERSVRESQTALANTSMALARGEVSYIEQARKGAKIGPHELRIPVTIAGDGLDHAPGEAFVDPAGENDLVLLTPNEFAAEDPVRTLYTLFITLTAVALLVTAAVAYFVALRVARPMTVLVDDVRTIANGRLDHRCRARVGGEVGLLAGAIDRMTASLRDARDAEVELNVREREREVALEVQSALRGAEVEPPAGYTVAAEHVTCDEPGGDFQGSIAAGDGRTVFFVSDVSGKGVPGALVGAMARAYLKSAFEDGGPLADTLKDVNRTLSREIRRGMYVTVLAAALDPETGEVEVASAGHKLPLVHWSAADGKVRTARPDGFALGFDKGPVFDRSITTNRIRLAPGDRVLLTNIGAVGVANGEGEEIGEKRLYRLFSRNADDTPEDALDGLLTAMEAFAGEEPFPADVVTVILGRDPA